MILFKTAIDTYEQMEHVPHHEAVETLSRNTKLSRSKDPLTEVSMSWSNRSRNRSKVNTKVNAFTPACSNLSKEQSHAEDQLNTFTSTPKKVFTNETMKAANHCPMNMTWISKGNAKAGDELAISTSRCSPLSQKTTLHENGTSSDNMESETCKSSCSKTIDISGNEITYFNQEIKRLQILFRGDLIIRINMVRTYKRKPGSRKYCDFDEEAVKIAVSRHRDEGVAVTQLSKEYNIPIATLYRKIRGKYPKKHGGQLAMSKDEEDMLANAIGVAADWGYPCDSNDIKDIVQNYLGRHGRTAPQFVNNRPGQTWLQFFLLRHKEKLSKRLSQSIKESRAKVCHETVNKYFDNLAESLRDVPPSAVVNYDEMNFTDDPGRVKVIVRESCKRAEKIMDSSKAATSVMFACAASGSLLPVYIVYKADHL
ncbi:hypothetical protein JTB14_007980 [Gonioctena quinquepunctata]|nr:hypothetical protein JTB14_007980 [Gonioctena quinquepunctata]